MRRGNGEGSVFKLAGKRRKPWAARVTTGWTEEGKQKLKYVGYYLTKKEAREALNKYLANPYDLDNKSITLLEVYKQWEKSTTLAENTLKNYKASFNRCNSLHNEPIRSLKVAHIEECIGEFPPSVQHFAKNVLARVYEFAEKNEVVEKNIIPLVQIEKHTAKKKKIPFTSDQVRMLLNYNDHYYAYTLKLLLYTGMRITELFDIETKNVNLEKRYMIGGKKSESGIDRIIPIHDEIYDIVKKRVEKGHKYLVTTPTGRHLKYTNYMPNFWRPFRQEMGFTQTPHDTRHTFVTFASRQGLDRIAIQKIIGHKGIDTTDRYDYRDVEELLFEINKLEY